MDVPRPPCCVPQPTPPPHCCFLLQQLIRSHTPCHFLPAYRLPPWLPMAFPGLVSIISFASSRSCTVAEIGHEILRGTSLHPRAWATSAWRPPPHPRGRCRDGHPLFTDQRNSGIQGRVNFPPDWEHKGNWQMVLGQTPSRHATSTESETQQEVMPPPSQWAYTPYNTRAGSPHRQR